MKKIMILAITLMLSVIATAQEQITEGIVTTKQIISSDDAQTNSIFEQMGDLLGTIYFKENKVRAEVSNPMSGDVVAISNTTANKTETLTLMDTPAMGKVYMLQTVELTEELLKSVTVEEGTKTKTILGYECKEHTATVVQDGVKMKMTLYTTDKIIPVLNQQTAMLGGKIEGYPMYIEMEMNQQGMQMHITTEVTDLKRESVADTKFIMTPPEGYKKIPGM